MNTASPAVKVVTVRGYTRKDSHEVRYVGRFRGSVTMEVKVKDARGKPALRVTYGVKLWVRCEDGVVYLFYVGFRDLRDHDRSGCGYSRTGYISVHGMDLRVEWDHLPATVRAAYTTSVRRLRVCSRVMSAELAKMPRLLPLGSK